MSGLTGGLQLLFTAALSFPLLVAGTGCAGNGSGPSCLRGQAEVEQAHAKRRAALAFTRASFEKAVAEKGLRVIDLDLYSPAQLRMSEELARKVRSGQVEGVFTDEIDGEEVTYYRAWGGMIVGTTISETAVPFAADGSGRVYEVVHRPRKVADERLLLCGCGPPGSGMLQRDDGPPVSLVKLPEGSTFGGKVEIAYDLKVTSVGHDWKDERGKPCPAPP